MLVTTLRPVPDHRLQAHTPAASAPAPCQDPAPPQGRLPMPTPLRHPDAGLRLSGHWLEILSDLSLLGDLGLELATARVRLLDRISLGALRGDSALATLAGTEQSFRLLLTRCHALSAAPAGDALLLEDDLGRPLLRLRQVTADDWWLWHLVLRGILRGAERVVPVRQTPPALAPLSRHPLGALQTLCADDADAPGFTDTAELSGQLALEPARLRGDAAAAGGAAVAADPALISCALRSLCEEVLPLVLTTGSDALVLRRQAAFHLYEYAQGRARLTGDATCFEIDLAAIDSAWVVGGDTGDGCSRQLRLYDADGRALAIIAPVPTRAAGRGDTAAAHRRGEPHFWRSLMNALES
jgi:hypothetical protein